ncbi:hypothetical protein EC973_001824 [Apophysomyces ossiformis]|uniref:Poly [ADP-ribose] polymerase n=1 Tax=Apophysomyces ossiformis TaxID=679940 RepID=A0A8H7BT59_9FUNG|nr:hypothetical protein EC973_001824 [Apophysomyces ossiformis]
MEIPRQQFSQKLSTIRKAIEECDFLSIDTELSGLHRPGNSKRVDTLANRYAEYREASRRFIIIQFGLCTFKWDEPSGRYIAKPFNFYIFPTSMTGKIQPNRVFHTQAQAFDFLSKQSFDFNKWVYQGIPYLTRQEEKEYVEDAKRRLADELPDIPIDEKELPFVNAAREKIESWISNSNPEDPEGVNITTRNAYQRRLIYQEVRNRYEQLTADGRQGFIRVMRLNEKQLKQRAKERQKQFEKDCEYAVGFRKVIDWISESKKMVVGHNMLLDVCHIIGQFIEPLPESVGEFKNLAHSIFPNMIDTKYMSSAATELHPLVGTATSLDVLRFETNKEAFKNPHIGTSAFAMLRSLLTSPVEMDREFPRYLTEMAHEAGWDAYMTGAVFLKLVSYLEKAEDNLADAEEKEKPTTDDGWDIEDQGEENDDSNWLRTDEEEIYNYGSIRVPLMNGKDQLTPLLSIFVNKATMVRTGFECFDFIREEVIIEQANTFHIRGYTQSALESVLSLFDPFGRYIFETIDSESGFVIYENLHEDPVAVKRTVIEKLALIRTVSKDVVVETASDAHILRIPQALPNILYIVSMTRSERSASKRLQKADYSLRDRAARRPASITKRTDRQIPSASTDISARKRAVMAEKRRALAASAKTIGKVESIEDFQQPGSDKPILYLVRRSGHSQSTWEPATRIDSPELLAAFHQRVQENSGYAINSADAIETTGNRPSRMSKTRAAFRLKEMQEDIEQPEEPLVKRAKRRSDDTSEPKKTVVRKKRTRREEERIQAIIAARKERKLERASIVIDETIFAEDPSDCCSRCSVRLYRVAVENNDIDALKEVIANKQKVPHWKFEEREYTGDSVYKAAVLKGNFELIDLLLKDEEAGHLKIPSRYMSYASNTGYIGRSTFGFAVRKVNESRGNRQGNSAFYKQTGKDLMDVDYGRIYIRPNDLSILSCLHYPDHMQDQQVMDCFEKASFVEDGTNEAHYFIVASGNGILAAKRFEQNWQEGWYNHLHIGALKFRGEESFNTYRRNQIMKKLTLCKGLTPVACAAINPSSKYLDELYTALDASERNETDEHGRSIAHFAAASPTADCVNYLITKGFNLSLGDKYKFTPLMQAARFGRHLNIKPLLMYLNNNVLPAPEIADHTLFRNKRRPLHYAAHFGHAETCRTLIECGATVDPVDSGERATPLMLAAQQGHVECVRVLIELGANPEAEDRYNRTPLHLAARNGHYAVVKYLLQEGVDANSSDSSSNQPMHYAAAFGWLKIVKLLLVYGKADPSAVNVWRSTPCSVANLKGHIAIVEYLLSLPEHPIDVDFKDEDGRTMLHHCVVEKVQSTIEVEQLFRKARILLTKNADVNIKDMNGNTVMHSLANACYFKKHRPQGWIPPDAPKFPRPVPLAFDDEEGIAFQLELAKMILDAGADLSMKNSAGETPLAVAMSQKNFPIVETLIKHGATYWIDEDHKGNNFFHHFLEAQNRINWSINNTQFDSTRQERYFNQIQRIWRAVLATNPPQDALQVMGKTALAHSLYQVIDKQRKYFDEEVSKMRIKIRNSSSYRGYGQTETEQASTRTGVNFTLSFHNWCSSAKQFVDLCHADVNAVVQLPKDFKKKNPKAKPSDYPSGTGYTLLHISAELQHPELAEFLLSIGCDPNKPVGLGAACKKNTMPLSMTLSSQTKRPGQHLPDDSIQSKEYCNQIYDVIEPDYEALLRETVRTYIKYGASSCSPGEDGITPLMKASQMYNKDVVEILCQDKNVTPNVVDNSNHTALLYAAESVQRIYFQNKEDAIDLSVIEALLGIGETPNFKCKDGDSIFMQVIKFGYAPLFRLLLSNSVDHSLAKALETPLLVACKENVPEILQAYIQWLEREAIDVNIYDKQYNTPLSVVASNGNQHAVEVFIKHGALPDFQESTSLINAIREKHYEIARLLIQAGANVNRKVGKVSSPLQYAVKTEKHRFVQLILDAGADVHATNDKLQTALHLAIEQTKSQTNASLRIERLLLRFGADINATDILGRTPLHIAFTPLNVIPRMKKMTTIAKKFRTMVKEDNLIKSRKTEIQEYGEKYGLGDAESNQWFQNAKRKQLEKKDELRRREKKNPEQDEELRPTEQEKEVLKMYTDFEWESDSVTRTRRDPIDIIRVLAEYNQLQYDTADHFGRTPLHYAACVGAFSSTTYLLDKKVDINAEDEDKNSPLQLSLLHNHVDYSVMLCNSGALVTKDLVCPDGKQVSTFHYSLSLSIMNMAYLIMEKDKSILVSASLQDALRTGKYHLADILLQSADISTLSGVLKPANQNLWHIISDFTPFDREAWDEYLEDFIEKISTIDIEICPDAHGRTPVHYAAKHGQDALLRHLVSQSACPLDIPDEEKTYELWYAVSSNNAECVQILLNSGVQVNQLMSGEKLSPLAAAVSQNNENIVRSLLQAGALTDSDSAFGRSNAVLLACLRNNRTILELLIRAGANLDTPSAMAISDKEKVNVYPFFAAAKASDIGILRLLVDNNADPNISCAYNGKEHPTKTLFTFTAEQSYLNKLKLLVKHPRINLNIKDGSSMRSIFYMYFFDRREKQLLDKTIYEDMIHYLQPSVNEVDASTGMTPLEVAIREHDIILVNRLLELYADPNVASCSIASDKCQGQQVAEPVNAVFHAVLHNDLAALKSLCQYSKYPIAWDAVDSQGRNVLCRLVIGTEGYSHENIDILQFLASTTGRHFFILAEVRDNKGRRAIDYAQLRCRKAIYDELLKLGVSPPSQDLSTDDSLTDDIDMDSISLDNVEEDADAERARLQLEKDAKRGPTEEKEEPVTIDQYSQLQHIGIVALDFDNQPFDIMLMKVDIKHGCVGLNMFYKLSVIYNKILDLYVLWTRWGSFGEEGMHQKTPFLTKQEAVNEFKAIFKAKTGNFWEDRLTSFTPKPGRFELITVKEKKTVDIILEDYDFTKSDVPAQIPSSLYNTMRFFCNFSYLQKGFKNANLDIPVGQVPQSSITKAYAIFQEIESLKQEFEQRSQRMSVTERYSAQKLHHHTLVQKSNEYYRLLPKTNDKNKGIRPLIQQHLVNAELARLNDVAYLNFSANVALATKHKANEINPLDYAYRSLGCRLTEIDPDLVEYDMVSKYMTSTAKTTGYEISYLFAVDRAEERERFQPFANNFNRKLLWHGSSIGNFLGILKQGLRCKPSISGDNGSMYGNGIYFADMFAKSINYAYNNYDDVDSAFSLLLLCEVALGKECEMTCFKKDSYSPSDGHMSVKGLGKCGPNPTNTIIDEQGVQIPMGPPINIEYESSYLESLGSPYYSLLNHHEYIVYDEAQVKIRYLVLVRNTNYCFLCRQQVGESSVKPMKDYKLTAYNDCNLNDYEKQLINAYLSHTNQTAKSVFDEDLSEFIGSGQYKQRWQTPIDLSLTSKICYKCAHSATTMMLVKRMKISPNKLPDAILERPLCKYGFECHNKNHLYHAKRYQHWQEKMPEDTSSSEDTTDLDLCNTNVESMQTDFSGHNDDNDDNDYSDYNNDMIVDD